MAHDVFISHSAKDKLTADALCASLEARGVRCWIAPRDILPSVEWGEAIVRALNASQLMILLFSANANQSPQIRREVERAVNKEIPIIPFRIENVLLSESLEYYLSTSHWLDALTPPMEKHFQSLGETVEILLSRRGRGTQGDRPDRWRQEQQPAPEQPLPKPRVPHSPVPEQPHPRYPLTMPRVPQSVPGPVTQPHIPPQPIQNTSGAAGRNATIALALGIVSLLCVGIITGPIAIIVGLRELKAIDAGRSSPTGRGRAKAGMVLGFIALAFYVIVLIVYLGNIKPMRFD